MNPDTSRSGRLRFTSLGNAGVALEHGGKRLYIDAYFAHAPSVGTAPVLDPDNDPAPDLLLITHYHPDHCLPSSVMRAAEQARAASRPMTVAGPRRVVSALEGKVPPEWLVELEPRENAMPPASVERDFGFASVVAYRTWHGGHSHNSYRVRWNGATVFHDGDNERTQPFDTETMGRPDLLCLCPWQGSGAEELVARWQPETWALIHLTDEEIDQHRRGEFLPALFSRPPDRPPVAPRPGESFDIG